MKQIIVRLSEVSKLYAGGDAPKEVSTIRTEEFKYPIFSNGLVEDGLYGFCKKATMKANTITVSARGTIGAAFYRTEPFLPIVRLITIEPDDQKINRRYLYYYLQMNKLEGYGTSQQQLTLPFMKKRKLLVFDDIQYQAKVSTLLNNYDQLVSNNKGRIKILEDMMYSIFKEWFIRFRYPGCSGINSKKESELGKIPNSFEILKANEIFDYYIGGGWGNDERSDSFPVDAYVIRGTDFPYVSRSDVSTCPYRFHKISNFKPRQLRENDIVLEISGGTAEQPVGRTIIVTKSVIEQLDDKVICASFCKLIRPKYTNITPYYLYFWLKFFYDTRMIERFQLQSTGIINFKYEYYLKKGPIMVPPMELMKRFEETIKPMREEIEKLALENGLLQKQRDALLPRLMSGKLSVEGKEIV